MDVPEYDTWFELSIENDRGTWDYVDDYDTREEAEALVIGLGAEYEGVRHLILKKRGQVQEGESP